MSLTPLFTSWVKWMMKWIKLAVVYFSWMTRSALVNLQLGTWKPPALGSGKPGGFSWCESMELCIAPLALPAGLRSGGTQGRGSNPTRVGVCYRRYLTGAAGLGLFFQSFGSSEL